MVAATPLSSLLRAAPTTTRSCAAASCSGGCRLAAAARAAAARAAAALVGVADCDRALPWRADGAATDDGTYAALSYLVLDGDDGDGLFSWCEEGEQHAALARHIGVRAPQSALGTARVPLRGTRRWAVPRPGARSATA